MAGGPGPGERTTELANPEPATLHDTAVETPAAEQPLPSEAIATTATQPEEATLIGSRLSFRLRLTLALLLTAVAPLAGFGLVLLTRVVQRGDPDPALRSLLLLGIAAAAILGVLVALLLAADLTAPLRAIAGAVERVSRGDLSSRIEVVGTDELARLAESHNRLAADLERRNRELRSILAAIEEATPSNGVGQLIDMAARDARAALGMIDAAILLGDPQTVPVTAPVPGEPRPVRAVLRLGDEIVVVFVGRLPATRVWEPADQDLLELFAAEIAVAIRNAQLFERVEAQNARLMELDAAKDDFLRGVSHNLQTPLTSIRAYAEQLGTDRPDRRLSIIGEQADRLSRMVRQLLTVSRLESGALRSRSEVLALAPHVRRAWEALAAEGVPFKLDDQGQGWLAVADPDQLDQVLWALLDNAVKYGAGATVMATIAPIPGRGQVGLTIADDGPGLADADRAGLFGRYARSAGDGHPEGTGLGLYVSRELCRAMGGDLYLEPGPGASFVVALPGEPPEEGEAARVG
ncbi:MAG: ATP-binding protein [Chloroflexota bacterium]